MPKRPKKKTRKDKIRESAIGRMPKELIKELNEMDVDPEKDKN
uniref:Uncharacterized protein n=1 Tax=viral metagenome TaxID=1070528 RepID=A0A6M3JLX0_9ZZZZ